MKLSVLPKKELQEMSESEKQITHIALLNIIALVSAVVTGKGAVSNPLNDKGDIGFEVHLDPSVNAEETKLFEERLHKQVENFLLLSDVPCALSLSKE